MLLLTSTITTVAAARRAPFAFAHRRGKQHGCFVSFLPSSTQQLRKVSNSRLFSTAIPVIETPSSNMTSSQSQSTITTTKPTPPPPPTPQKIQARKVSATPTSLSLCGQRLAQNNLVSFPTETVYGLGCHALNENAIQKVFAAKERPLTDPLIVHVNSFQEASKLWNATVTTPPTTTTTESSSLLSIEAKVLQALTTHFWPGPLTIVASAHLPSVPSIVMANTGYVACRSPSHPIAQSLIKEAGVPIAAPSANKFGHVSPTRASHVWDDLKGEDVWIVDPDLKEEEEVVVVVEEESGKKRRLEEEKKGELNEEEEEEEEKAVVCNVGVESTVIKVEPPSSITNDNDEKKGVITILRHGAISQSDLKSCLTQEDLVQYFQVLSKQQQVTRSKSSSLEDDDEDDKEEEQKIIKADLQIAHVAPGQTIRHYSPHVTSYMISHSRCFDSSTTTTTTISPKEEKILAKAVILDYNQTLKSLQKYALAYRDLSSGGNSKEAASRVFEMLRWSEGVEGAERVYFPELVVVEDGREVEKREEDALILAVKDRLTRAASGVVIDTLC